MLMKPVLSYFFIFYLLGFLFGRINLIMETITEMNKPAYIIATIIVNFDFKSCGEDYSAGAFLNLFDASNMIVTVDEIKHSLLEHSFKKVIMNYGLELSKHYGKEDIPISGSKSGRRVKYLNGGICQKILGYEFPGIDETISNNYSDDKRVDAIMRMIALSNITTGIAVTERKRKHSSISSSSFEHVSRDVASTGSGSLIPSGRVEPEKVQNTRRISSKSLQSYEIEKKLKDVMGMLEIYPPEVSTGLISFFCDKENPNNKRACIIHECSKILEEELGGLKESIRSEGLNLSKAYSTGDYNKPVKDSSLRVEIAKAEAPFLFDVMMALVCSQNQKEKAFASVTRIKNMTDLFTYNRKTNRTNTVEGLLEKVYGKRLPSHVKNALNLSSTPSIVPNGSSCFTMEGSNVTSDTDNITSSISDIGASSLLAVGGVPSSSSSSVGSAERGRNTTSSEVLYSVCFQTPNPDLIVDTSHDLTDYSTERIQSLINNIEEDAILDRSDIVDEEKLLTLINLIKEAAAKSDQGVLEKETMAANACELILNMRENGSALTPLGVQNGLIANLCGLSNQGQDIFSVEGIMCGRTTTKRILLDLGEVYNTYVDAYLKDSHGLNNEKILVIFDNYNILRWLKRVKTDEAFTQNAPSLSILVKRLQCRKKEGEKDAYIPFDWDSLSLSLGEAWDLDPKFNAARDPSFDNQSIWNFLPYPSIEGKSSSEEDIREKVVRHLLQSLCNMCTDEVAVVVDPEILLLLAKIAHLDPEMMKNIIICPPIFHIRKHCMENLFCDPVNLLLLGLPVFIECYGLQIAKKREQACTTLMKMEKRISEAKKNNEVRLVKVLEKVKNKGPKETNEAENEPLISMATGSEEGTVPVLAGNNDIPPDMLSDYLNQPADKRCASRLLVDATKGSEDSDDDSDDDEDEAYKEDEVGDEGNGAGPSGKKLYTDEEYRKIIIIIREYCELGLRGTDLSHSELSSAKINLARQWMIIGQIVRAYEDAKVNIDLTLGESPSWSAALVRDLLKNGFLGICTKPFKDIVIEGYGQEFVKKFNDITHLMSHYKRYKVSRSYLFLIHCFDNYRKDRHDILEFYLENCCSFNDLYIELFNSLVNGALPSNMKIRSIDIKNASSRVVIKHGIIQALRIAHNLTGNKGSNGQGETRIEEMKYASATNRDEAARIQEWLQNHFERLQRFITPESVPIEGIKYCTNMDKIEGLIERGSNITLNTIIPDYKKYLVKITNKKDQIERSKHLSKLVNILDNKAMTIKFLMVTLAGKNFFFKTAKGVIRKTLPTREAVVTEVKKCYSTYKEFKKFIISVNLNKNNQERLYLQYLTPVEVDIDVNMNDDVEMNDNI
jgi:hypothetical protein